MILSVFVGPVRGALDGMAGTWQVRVSAPPEVTDAMKAQLASSPLLSSKMNGQTFARFRYELKNGSLELGDMLP